MPCFCARLSANRLEEVPIKRADTAHLCGIGHRHQHASRRGVRALAHAQRQRQERRHQRDVFDEGPQRRDHQHHRQGQQPWRLISHQQTGQRLQCAGALDAQAQREHRRHRHRGLVAETAISASTGLTTPSTTSAASAISATRSMRTFSLAKSPIATVDDGDRGPCLPAHSTLSREPPSRAGADFDNGFACGLRACRQSGMSSS